MIRILMIGLMSGLALSCQYGDNLQPEMELPTMYDAAPVSDAGTEDASAPAPAPAPGGVPFADCRIVFESGSPSP